MIIFGTTGIKSTIKEGNFNCPQCESSVPYRHRKVNKFFTLYFIPLIPLGSAGEYVECKHCKGTFVPRVLNYSNENTKDQFLSQYEKAMKHCMVLIMLADGEIDENEMLMVQKIINKFGHNDVTLDELDAYVKEVQNGPLNITTYLKSVAPSLNEHGKEIVIKCALSVAASDGHIDDSEIAMINEMAKTMQMSNSHLKGIITDFAKPKQPEFSQN